MLEIQCHRKGVLFNPNSMEKYFIEFQQSQSLDISVQSFCETLSIVCNNFVMPILTWTELGESIFPFGFGTKCDMNFDGRDKSKQIGLNKSMLEEARVYYQGRCKISDETIDISISRWVLSKHPSESLNEKCVNLRIALESLFLSRSKKRHVFGKGYQSAAHCSCFLDKNPSENSRRFNSIREFYRISSEVIHSSQKHTYMEKQISLNKAQKIYLEAIKKTLIGAEVPKWDNLLEKNRNNFEYKFKKVKLK